MHRKLASSPQARPELRRRYVAGGALAVLGLLLMGAAFHPDTNDAVMRWVQSRTLAFLPSDLGPATLPSSGVVLQDPYATSAPQCAHH